MIFSPLRSPMRSPLEPAVGRSYGLSLEAAAVAAVARNGGSLWYVPADLSGVFQNSGATGAPAVSSPVGYVADRVGSANITQATGTSRPTLIQLPGGQYALSFDGSADFLAAASLGTASTGTFIASCNPGAVLARGIVGNGGASIAAVGATLGTTATPSVRLARSDGIANTPVLSGGVYAAGVPFVAAATWNGTAGVLRVGGVQAATGAGPVSTSSAAIVVGATSSGGAGAFNGSISLACYAPVVMSDADIIAIERFAAALAGASY